MLITYFFDVYASFCSIKITYYTGIKYFKDF